MMIEYEHQIIKQNLKSKCRRGTHLYSFLEDRYAVSKMHTRLLLLRHSGIFLWPKPNAEISYTKTWSYIYTLIHGQNFPIILSSTTSDTHFIRNIEYIKPRLFHYIWRTMNRYDQNETSGKQVYMNFDSRVNFKNMQFSSPGGLF